MHPAEKVKLASLYPYRPSGPDKSTKSDGISVPQTSVFFAFQTISSHLGHICRHKCFFSKFVWEMAGLKNFQVTISHEQSDIVHLKITNRKPWTGNRLHMFPPYFHFRLSRQRPVEAVFDQLSCPSAHVYVHISTSGMTASCNHDSDHTECGGVYNIQSSTPSVVFLAEVFSTPNISTCVGPTSTKF